MLLEQDPTLQTLPHVSSQEPTTHKTRQDSNRNKQHTRKIKTPNELTFHISGPNTKSPFLKKTKRKETGIENVSVSTMVADDDGGATRRYRTRHGCCAATKERPMAEITTKFNCEY
jgi:hypothetical protein